MQTATCRTLAAVLCGWILANESLAVQRTWNAGAGVWETAGNWSPPGTPQAADAVLITNAGASVVLSGPTAIASLTVGSAALTFTNWLTKLTVSGDVTVQSGGTITLPAAFTNNAMSNRVWIACNNLQVDANGKIDADSRGWARPPATAPAAGSGYGPGAGYRFGSGGHGGHGGWTPPYALGGVVYDSPTNPVEPGSGGGYDYGMLGGAGGGVIRIEATGNAIVNGTITANGEDCNFGSGGGAGGTVYLSCNTIQGTGGGVVSAAGGAATIASYSGGGGRIAVYYGPGAQAALSPVPSIRFDAGTKSGVTGFGDLGSLYFPDNYFLSTSITNLSGQWMVPGFTNWNVASLFISNAWIRFPASSFKLTVANDLTIAGTGKAPTAGLGLGGDSFYTAKVIPYSSSTGPELMVGGNLTVSGGGVLGIYSGVTNATTPNYGALVSVGGELGLASNCWVFPYSQVSNGGSVFFSLGNLRVDQGGGINADYKGYAGKNEYGNGPGRGYNYGGGSYGGMGGYLAGSPSGAPYGASNAPVQCGSAGGSGSSAPAYNGGGLIWVKATNTITLNGELRANGELCAYWYGGGSGGGIYLRCTTLDGSAAGTLLAKGGDNVQGGNGGGGGGGRIAVWRVNDAVATPETTFSNSVVAGADGTLGTRVAPEAGTIVWGTLASDWASRVMWVGGSGLWTDSTHWSSETVPTAADSIEIASGATVVLTNATTVGSLYVANSTLVFTNWETKLTALASVAVQAGGIITLPAAYTNGMSNRVWIACESLTVEAGGKIDADAKGWGRPASAGGAYYGWGPGTSFRDASAGHGGGGAAWPYGQPGPVCDSVTNPVEPGSSSGGAYSTVGGAGGGVIRVEATGAVTVDGAITARGEDMTLGSAGAGGSVYVACNTIRGSGGVVSAAGGGCAATYNSGGGGRIAVHYNPGAQAAIEPVPTMRFDAGTKSGVGGFGDLGTLYFPDNYFLSSSITGLSGQWMVPNFTHWNVASLFISNSWIRFPTNGFVLTVTNDLTIVGTGNVPSAGLGLGGDQLYTKSFLANPYSSGAGPELRVGGAMTLTNGGLLTLYAGITNAGIAYGAYVSVGSELRVATNCWVYPYSQPTNGGCAYFSVGGLRVDAGGGFNANEKGYAGRATATGRGTGPGAGYVYGGGSYGGTGGFNTNGQITSTWSPYGNSNAPVQCGSSGGSDGVNMGGCGGGLIWIKAAKTAVLNGTLTANGELGFYYSPAGSGGGIDLRCTTLVGAPSTRLLANGGGIHASSVAGPGAGGGGGRIAVWRVYDSPAGLQGIVSNAVNPGVNGAASTLPTAGTIVWGWVTPPGSVLMLK